MRVAVVENNSSQTTAQRTLPLKALKSGRKARLFFSVSLDLESGFFASSLCNFVCFRLQTHPAEDSTQRISGSVKLVHL